MSALRTIVPLALASLVLAAVGLPQASAEDHRGDHFVVADGQAQGRFVSFGLDAEAGQVCDWSFEGRTVIRSMTGVAGNVRTDGRAVVLGDGDSPDGDGCGVSASAGGDADADDEGDDADDDEGGAAGNASSNGTRTSASSPSGTGNASGADDEDDDDEADGATSTTPQRRPAAAGVRAKLHDTPNGAIAIDLDAGKPVRLDFASGVRLAQEDAKVRVTGDGLRATLFANQGSADVDFDIEGRSVTLTADAKAKVHFRIGDAALDERRGGQMQERVDDGDVACEVFVSDDDRPHVVDLGDANVTVASTHTSVRVDLDIDLDVDVHVDGGDGDGGTVTETRTATATRTATQTQTQTATRTVTQTQTGGDGGDGDDSDGGDDADDDAPRGNGCGCAAKVLILDVDVTVLVLEADDDLLVRLDGELLPRADSVEDALTIEAGEDPEALVVVNQEQEVKVLLALGEGRNQVSLEPQEGEQFQTREPVRYPAPPRDDGLADLDSFEVEPQDDDGAEATVDADDTGGGISVPGPGLGLVALAVVAGAALAVRRRL